MFKGTDPNAFKRAKKGNTPEERSRKYKIYKKQNKLKDFFKTIFHTNNHQTPRKVKIRNKNKTLLHSKQNAIKSSIKNDIKKCKDSRIFSNIVKSIVEFILRREKKHWGIDTTNNAQEIVSFIVFEVLNDLYEKPKEILEKTEMFFKISETIYKVIVWVNKNTFLWETNDKHVSIVNDNNKGYNKFLKSHPKIAKNVKEEASILKDGEEMFIAILKGEIPERFFSYKAIWKKMANIFNKYTSETNNSCTFFKYNNKIYWVGAISLQVSDKSYEMIADYIEVDLKKMGATNITRKLGFN